MYVPLITLMKILIKINNNMAVRDSLLDCGTEDKELPDSVMKSLLIQEPMTQYTSPSAEALAKSVTPQPGFCLKTKTEKDEKIFINICTSTEVPSPKDITDEQLQAILESGDAVNYRVPLSLGEPHTENDNAGKECSVYDVIISTGFFDTIQKRPLMKNFLLTVILEGLEDKYSLRLCRDCRIMKNRTFFGTMPEQTVRDQPKPFIIEVNKEEKKKDTTKMEKSENLIPEPKFTIIREPVEGEVPDFLVMEVDLMGVSSSRNIVLDVGEDRVVLTARPNLYHLDIDLPFTVDADETGAQFDKETRVLTVTLTVTGKAS